jgi:2-polyprenyl-6-methoxyphenol hydroxylase-like FAD-dependent oxidoreductase
MKKTMNFDVVVLGAGPCGLWLACELKLAGVNVCVLEKRKERMAQSRSLTIHGRTLEMFELRGMDERFLAVGRPIKDWHFAGLQTRLDFSGFNARHPFMLFIPQTHTERLLEERAIELGVNIYRDWSADHVSQAGNACTIAGTSPDGRYELEASFVIGADGARSLVRERAGIAFEGVEATQSIMMADAPLDLPPGPPMLSVEGKEGALTILPLEKGVYRIICLDFARSHIDRHHPMSEQELRESIVRILGDDLNLRNPTWLTRFSDETKVANTYRQGRVLLVGDAAHIHAPMGGQGLNVGLQDAMNLGWKLASVIKDGAPDILLDTYETERRPVGLRLAENTLAQVALASNLTDAGLALRRTMSRLLCNASLNRELAGEISGFDLTYPVPLPGFESMNESSEASLQGCRVPDLDIHKHDGSKWSLHARMVDGNWLLLGADPQRPVSLPPWLCGGRLRQETCASKNMPGDARTILIRPDGYIAAAWT